MYAYVIIVFMRRVQRRDNFFKRMHYYQRYRVSKNHNFGAANIICAYIKFPFPGPISEYNNFKSDVDNFIKS